MAKEHRAKLLSNNSPLTGLLGGAAGGALITAFANKKSARKLLKAGGLVALGGVAWHAYRSYKDGAGKDDSTRWRQVPTLTVRSWCRP
jgi:uncharacterized membrane protein YebE (DUF533 family)